MKIVINSIPTKDHRYPTLGDYWIEEQGALQFRVSEELSPRAQVLLLLHEMVEAFLCQNDGVTFESIDDFDNDFEKRCVNETDEPGDDPDAPYRKQHRRAENLERLMADFLGVDWAAYVTEFDNVCKVLDSLSKNGHWNR